MQFHFTIPQTAPLNDVVRNFWQADREHTSLLNETIIPKGIIEIIFNFGKTITEARINSLSFTVPRCFIQGFHTTPIQLLNSGSQTSFGVVLCPAAVKPVLNFLPSEFTNTVIDLSLVDASFNSLWHQLQEQNSFNARVDVFSEWLKKKLPELTGRERAFNNFLDGHGNTALSVPDVAAELCYSTKQLSRKLYELTGMNTEQTLLFKKYLHAVHLIHHSQLPLTEIVYDCHFSDQSHFIRTFKSFAQLTPKKYKSRKSMIAGHLQENVL